MKKCIILFLILMLSAPAALAIGWEDVEFGGMVRVRGYDLNNVWDFNDDGLSGGAVPADYDNWKVFRIYTSLQTKVTLPSNVTAFVKIANQNYSEGVTYAGQWEKDNEANKVFVDNAYIAANSLFGCPQFRLMAGRQNLMYGSGFVLFDGQSQFASTSLYFDGVKLSWDLIEPQKDRMATLDFLYFKDQENNRSEVTDDDITLSGAYLTAKCPVIGGQQEIYALNRDDQLLDKEIWMYGIRISDKIAIGADQPPFTFDYSGEFAWQTGEWTDNQDQDAMGYKLDAGMTFNMIEAFKPRLFLGYAFLEGDDPDTDDNERWDVYYGGWPQFGDLLAWKYVNLGPTYNSISDYDPTWNEGSSVGGEAVFSNIKIATVGFSTILYQNLSGQVSYSMLTADETVAGADDDFGDYYQLSLKYGYSANLSFSVYSAMIEPGDAFINDDAAYEVFWETKVVF